MVTVSTLTYFELKRLFLLFANFTVNESTLSIKYSPSSKSPVPLTNLVALLPNSSM